MKQPKKLHFWPVKRVRLMSHKRRKRLRAVLAVAWCDVQVFVMPKLQPSSQPRLPLFTGHVVNPARTAKVVPLAGVEYAVPSITALLPIIEQQQIASKAKQRLLLSQARYKQVGAAATGVEAEMLRFGKVLFEYEVSERLRKLDN